LKTMLHFLMALLVFSISIFLTTFYELVLTPQGLFVLDKVHLPREIKSTPTSLPKQEKDPSESFNMVLLGGDSTSQNTDTILLVNTNLSSGQIHILSIPRDTKISASSGSYKLNFSYAKGGGQKTCQDIESLLGIRVPYYAYLDLKSFRQIIDDLDGVRFEIPEDLHYRDPLQNLNIQLKKGNQVLDGRQAESFLRFRQFKSGKVTKYYDGGDLRRIEAQQAFLKALFEQKWNLKYLPKIKTITEIFLNNLDTNLTPSQILKTLNKISYFKTDKVMFKTLPGDAVYMDDIWYYEMEQNEVEILVASWFP
jgi:polyisoprenyl-teichoic acid--peptidoglycan teichoic acid transferase